MSDSSTDCAVLVVYVVDDNVVAQREEVDCNVDFGTAVLAAAGTNPVAPVDKDYRLCHHQQMRCLLILLCL